VDESAAASALANPQAMRFLQHERLSVAHQIICFTYIENTIYPLLVLPRLPSPTQHTNCLLHLIALHSVRLRAST
jgi:hypothetical protein